MTVAISQSSSSSSSSCVASEIHRFTMTTISILPKISRWSIVVALSDLVDAPAVEPTERTFPSRLDGRPLVDVASDYVVDWCPLVDPGNMATVSGSRLWHFVCIASRFFISEPSTQAYHDSAAKFQERNDDSSVLLDFCRMDARQGGHMTTVD